MSTQPRPTADTGRAHREWATRPAHERFWSVADMQRAAGREMDASRSERRSAAQLAVIPSADGRGLQLAKAGSGLHGSGADLGYHAVGQLASLTGAPAGYMRDLPADLAARCLTHGLQERAQDVQVLLSAADGSPRVRAITGPDYRRLWTARLLETVSALVSRRPSLRTPPAWAPSGYDGATRVATTDDVGPWTLVKPGDVIAPAGAYYGPDSGRDTFLFLLDTERPIRLPNTDGAPGFRFLCLWNDEGGAASVGGIAGIIDAACGNHNLLNPRGVNEWRFRHVGRVASRTSIGMGDFVRRLDTPALEQEQMLQAASLKRMGATVIEADAKVVSVTKLPAATVRAGRERAEKAGRYGDPLSAYSYASGLTEASQALHVDERLDVDRAAGKLLAVAAGAF